jgi:hypothetical protein
LDNLVSCSFFNAFDHTAPAEELSFISNTLANSRHERDGY